MLQMVSTLEGTLTAGPWIDLCLPDGNATIFMKGTRRQISSLWCGVILWQLHGPLFCEMSRMMYGNTMYMYICI